MTVTLGYFIVKMEALVQRSDPIINTNTVKDYYDSNSEGLNLDQNNLHFAISVNDRFDGRSLYDPRYVRLVAQLVTTDEDGNEAKVDKPLHNCTAEDWAKFYPPDYDTEPFIKAAEDNS